MPPLSLLGLRKWFSRKICSVFKPKRPVMVVPIYKERLTEPELMRISLSFSNWNESIFFLGPNGLDRNYYTQKWPLASHVEFPDEYFIDVDGYNRLMLQPCLYDYFKEFSFILVLQPDAILIKGFAPEEFLGMQFDFLGASWNPSYAVSWNPISGQLGVGVCSRTRRRLHVGNGGLSIRRVSTFRIVSRLLPPNLHGANEDIIYAYFLPLMGARVAKKEVADRFFQESLTRSWETSQETPNVNGFHGIYRYSPALESRIFEDFRRSLPG